MGYHSYKAQIQIQRDVQRPGVGQKEAITYVSVDIFNFSVVVVRTLGPPPPGKFPPDWYPLVVFPMLMWSFLFWDKFPPGTEELVSSPEIHSCC